MRVFFTVCQARAVGKQGKRIWKLSEFSVKVVG
jgi:hypothetical protein